MLPHGLVRHAVQNDGTKTLVLVDAMWHVIEQGDGGIIIVFVYGSKATITKIQCNRRELNQAMPWAPKGTNPSA